MLSNTHINQPQRHSLPTFTAALSKLCKMSKISPKSKLSFGNAIRLQVFQQHGLSDGPLLQAPLEHAAIFEKYERGQPVHLAQKHADSLAENISRHHVCAHACC